MKWPLLRVAVLYAVGVLIGSLVPGWPFILLACTLGLLGVALAWSRFRGTLIYAILFLAGWTNYTLQTAVLSPHDLRQIIGKEAALASIRGRLVETPTLRVFEQGPTPAWRTLARIEVSAIRLDKQDWQPANGRIAVATPGALTNLFGAQTVEIAGVVSLPKGPVAEGCFDYRSILRQQGVYYRLQADSEQDWKVLSSPPKAPLPDRFRNWGRQALARGLPAEDESLRLEWALTLGWKAALTEESSEPFIRAATYHIFAVDGLRMAIVFGILLGLLRACAVPRAIAGLTLLPMVWFYVALTGWPASAIRAVVMLTVIIVGWVLKRPSNLINSLFTAALIILLWEPAQLFQAGFQLSFVVVLCLILMLPPFYEWMKRLTAPDPLMPVSLRRRWPTWIGIPTRHGVDLFGTSLVAWLGSIPLVAYYFNIITPVSTPANIIAVPLCALVLMSNLGSLLLAGWFPGASVLFNHAGWFLMECIRVTSVWFADWPKAWFYVAAPSPGTILLYYGLLLALVTGWLLKPVLRPWRISAAGLAIAAWCVSFWPELRTTRLTVLPASGGVVSYFDARGTSNDLLIDTGNTNGVQFITKPFLRASGVNSVQRLVLSHGDLHHVGGAGALTRAFPVRQVCASPLRFRSKAYRRTLQDFAETPRLLNTIGRADRLGHWEVLHPEKSDRFAKADDGAVVLRGNFNGTPILLLSDLGRAGQDRLLERIPDLRADILVTGLPSGSEPICDAFLDAVKPRVIVVADSEFPVSERASARLRDRLSDRGVPVLYTRLTGAATIEFCGRSWQIRTMLGPTLSKDRSSRTLPLATEPPVGAAEMDTPAEED